MGIERQLPVPVMLPWNSGTPLVALMPAMLLKSILSLPCTNVRNRVGRGRIRIGCGIVDEGIGPALPLRLSRQRRLSACRHPPRLSACRRRPCRR